MTEIVELVLEDVPVHKVDDLAAALFSRADVTSVYLSESADIELSEFSWDFRNSILEGGEESSIVLSVQKAKVRDIELNAVVVQIVRYAGHIDFSISFPMPSGQEGDGWIRSLEQRVASLVRDFGLIRFLCGYEPATDPETRFFSDAGEGPLLSHTRGAGLGG